MTAEFPYCGMYVCEKWTVAVMIDELCLLTQPTHLQIAAQSCPVLRKTRRSKLVIFARVKNAGVERLSSIETHRISFLGPYSCCSENGLQWLAVCSDNRPFLLQKTFDALITRGPPSPNQRRIQIGHRIKTDKRRGSPQGWSINLDADHSLTSNKLSTLSYL